MLGTLAGGLSVRGVDVKDLVADATGELELRDRLPVLTRIVVNYKMTIPAGTRETVERLLSKHQEKCPTAVTFKDVIDISYTADIREA